MPSWVDVEQVLSGLAASGEWFETVSGERNRIVRYRPGDLVTVETKKGIDDVAVADIRECWSTLETHRKARLQDFLRPGFRSAFMGAVFRRVPGVREEGKRPTYLVI